ncbi:MAG: type I-B CRISPR-associated protein Cas7/Cst2/DevR [Deltaproteobacteria bacterium]|nr:type I-B CRISPR-associated protein Cas7/Cst2/DevR [Deltaproteobacteria bacterium]
MSLHVFGAIVTGYGCAANNRGETEGNITTLQKLLWKGQVHTTVSAEAIRWALRYYWQRAGKPVNWQWDDEKDDHVWQDAKWTGWANESGTTHIDDDVLGFMKAEGGKAEGEKGTTTKRRGVLEVARAISTTPFAGDISFNAKSGEKDRTSLYGTEIHATRYQYGFALTPERLRVRSRCLDVLDGLVNLGEVAGNHSRFLFDFSPESIVLRVTQDPAPRILYCFSDEDGRLSLPELLRRVSAKDVDPTELFIGGPIAELAEVKALGAKKCELGVKSAVEAARTALRTELELGGDSGNEPV